MEQCIDFRINIYPWLMKPEIGMTRNEMMVYCVICDFIRNGLPAHPTYAQLADVLGSEDNTSSCPWISRNAVDGLVKKGFIARPVRGNSHGRANEYELIRTPRELFDIVDRNRPGYFSDSMREEYAKELNLNIEISHSLRIAPTEQSHQDRPANNIPTQPTASRLHRDTTLPAKPVEQNKEQETPFDDIDFLNDCGLNDEQSTPKVETVTVITTDGEEIEVPVEQPDDDVDDPDVPENEEHPKQISTHIDGKDMDPQQRAYFNKQNNAEWSDDLLADIPF
ncbi:TPA: hypothetical protein ACJIMT_004918 [Escherichia coli]